eukprot:COSAG02_NODE_36145_length_458_cov_1.000000_1_plen_61_part_10
MDSPIALATSVFTHCLLCTSKFADHSFNYLTPGTVASMQTVNSRQPIDLGAPVTVLECVSG